MFSVEIISSTLSLTGLVFTFSTSCIRPPSAGGSDVSVSSVKIPWVYFCLMHLLRSKHIGYVSRNSIQKQARQLESLMLFGLFTLYFIMFNVPSETSQNFSVAWINFYHGQRIWLFLCFLPYVAAWLDCINWKAIFNWKGSRRNRCFQANMIFKVWPSKQ